MPRSYRLGRRADEMAGTRSRIVAAALAVFRERGLAGASNLAIANAADVAPATVRNHFPDQGDLARAVFEALLVELRIPTESIFEGADGLAARIERLAHELADFYERSEPWWRAYEREPELIQVWGGGVDQFYADIERLMRASLGQLGDDEEAVAVVAAVIGPPTFFALRGRGLSGVDAVRLSVDLVVPWLEARARGQRSVATNVRRPRGRR